MKQPSFSDSVSAWFKRYVIAAQVVAFACTIVIGLSSNNLSDSSWALFLLIFSSLIYATIEIGRGLSTKFYIPEYIKNLEYQIEKKNLETEKNRLNKSFDRISNAIFRLNGRTCSAQGLTEPDLCSQEMLDSINDLLYGMITNPNLFFGNDIAKYCIIVRIDWIIGREESKYFVLYNNLFQELNFDRTNIDNSTENYINRNSRAAIVTNEPLHKSKEGVNFCFVNIFEVCSNYGSNGAIILASDLDKFSDDYIQKEIEIIARIITNWLYNYNQCVLRMKAAKENACPNYTAGLCTLTTPNPPAQ